jgi:outer membrane protein assembly factor BamB
MGSTWWILPEGARHGEIRASAALLLLSGAMTRPRRARLGLLAALLIAEGAHATTTRFFRQTTVKDFEEGEATSSAVSPPGEVLPGMKVTRVPIDAAFAWSAALSRDGSIGYVGTGDRGQIFAVPTAGDGPAKQLAELDAPWVTALAVRPDGSLLAGSTPGARLFSVDAKSGKVKRVARLPAEHVWALEYDPARAVTYAATGDGGKIFAVDGKGGVRLLWDSGDKHVMALARDGASLLAGTAGKAIVYRVHANGRAEALQDFDADEVRAIVRGKAATYLAVNDFDKPAEANQPAPGGPQVAKGTRIVAGPAPASGAIPRSGAVKARAAVYRLGDEGGIEQLFALADGYFTALFLDRGGNLFAASGSQGKLYRIAPDRTVALVADVPERQVLSMLPAGDGFLLGSGDVGAIYRVRPTKGGEATYLSKVFDAEAPALWGEMWWTGSHDLVLETRTGNTGKPDASWSPFRRVEAVKQHQGDSAARVASPGARYLQYRVALPRRQSVLQDISIYYLPHNQRARVTEVYLGDVAGAGAGGTGGTITAPSTAPVRTHSSTLKLRWKVDNPDGDDLIYKLWCRRQGDTVWRPLAGSDPLTKAEYDWDTDSVADGRYLFRVWASDEKVTPAERALEYEFESPPFLVDNTRPEVSGLVFRGDQITGRARDATSVISAIEYAVDGGEWRPAAPEDDLLDDREEAFTARVPKTLAPGPHIVNVRAWDQADNVGSARIEIRIAK